MLTWSPYRIETRYTAEGDNITQDSRIRKIEKVDANGIPIQGTDFDALITRTDGDPAGDGEYILTAEKMNKANWRSDDSVSFVKSSDYVKPQPDGIRTVIKTTADGKTWIAPPDAAEALELTKEIPCKVKTGGSEIQVFETDTKQDALSIQQLNNISAVPYKADHATVGNKVDMRAGFNYDDGQKAQARENIGAASKDYVDSNKGGKWVNLYDANDEGAPVMGMALTGGICLYNGGSTEEFNQGNDIADGTEFKIEVRDRRQIYIMTSLIRFRFNHEAWCLLDSSSDGYYTNGAIGYRVRAFFTRATPTSVSFKVQASAVTSSAPTGWFAENNPNFFIMRIDKWVQPD